MGEPPGLLAAVAEYAHAQAVGDFATVRRVEPLLSAALAAPGDALWSPLLSPSASPFAQHFGLSLVLAAVRSPVVFMDEAVLRDTQAALWLAASSGGPSARKAGAVLGALAKRAPGSVWPPYCSSLLQSLQQPATSTKVAALAGLLSAAEELSAGDVAEAGADGLTARARRAARGALLADLPRIAAALLAELQQPAPPPSVVLLPVLALLEQLAGWAPLPSHASPALLDALLSLAGRGFTGGGGASETDVGRASLGVLTTLMSRQLLPPSLAGFTHAMARQTAAVLEALLAPAAAPAPPGTPQLCVLPPDALAALTEYLAAFAGNLLPRVHAEPPSPALPPLPRLLELLFGYAVAVAGAPSLGGDALTGALRVWAGVGSAASQLLSSTSGGGGGGGGGVEDAVATYRAAFSAMAGQLVDAVLFAPARRRAAGGMGPAGGLRSLDGPPPGALCPASEGAAPGGDDSGTDDEAAQAEVDAGGTVLADLAGGGDGDGGGEDGGVAVSAGGDSGGGVERAAALAGVLPAALQASERGAFQGGCRSLLAQLCGWDWRVAADVGLRLGGELAAATARALRAGGAPQDDVAAAVEDCVTLLLLLADVFWLLTPAAGEPGGPQAREGAALQRAVMEAVGGVLGQAAAPPRVYNAALYASRVTLQWLGRSAGQTPLQPGDGGGAQRAAGSALDASVAAVLSRVSPASAPATVALALAALSASAATPAGLLACAGALARLPPGEVTARVAALPVRHAAHLLLLALRGVAATEQRAGGGGAAAAHGSADTRAASLRALDAYFGEVRAPLTAPWYAAPGGGAAAAMAPAAFERSAAVLQRVLDALHATRGSAPGAGPLLELMVTAVLHPCIAPLGAAVGVAAGALADPASSAGASAGGAAAAAFASVASALALLSCVVRTCRPAIPNAVLAPLCAAMAPALDALPAALSSRDNRAASRLGAELLRLLRHMLRPGKLGASPAATAAHAAPPPPMEIIRRFAEGALLGPLAALAAPSHPAHGELFPPLCALWGDLLRCHWRAYVTGSAPRALGHAAAPAADRAPTSQAAAHAFSAMLAQQLAALAAPTLSPAGFRVALLTLARLHKEHRLLELGAAGDDAAASVGARVQVVLLDALLGGGRGSAEDDVRRLLWAAVAPAPARFAGATLPAWLDGRLRLLRASQAGGPEYTLVTLVGVRRVGAHDAAVLAAVAAGGGVAPAEGELRAAVMALQAQAGGALDASSFDASLRDVIALAVGLGLRLH